MEHCIIEHWRDGERIAKYDMTKQEVQQVAGQVRIVLPPGTITFTTGDELRFNPQALIDQCQKYV